MKVKKVGNEYQIQIGRDKGKSYPTVEKAYVRLATFNDPVDSQFEMDRVNKGLAVSGPEWQEALSAHWANRFPMKNCACGPEYNCQNHCKGAMTRSIYERALEWLFADGFETSKTIDDLLQENAAKRRAA